VGAIKWGGGWWSCLGWGSCPRGLQSLALKQPDTKIGLSCSPASDKGQCGAGCGARVFSVLSPQSQCDHRPYFCG
jgi:hypothetical protein